MASNPIDINSQKQQLADCVRIPVKLSIDSGHVVQ